MYDSERDKGKERNGLHLFFLSYSHSCNTETSHRKNLLSPYFCLPLIYIYPIPSPFSLPSSSYLPLPTFLFLFRFPPFFFFSLSLSLHLFFPTQVTIISEDQFLAKITASNPKNLPVNWDADSNDNSKVTVATSKQSVTANKKESSTAYPPVYPPVYPGAAASAYGSSSSSSSSSNSNRSKGNTNNTSAKVNGDINICNFFIYYLQIGCLGVRIVING